MKKLQRGISTNIDFIRAMKERGQDVNADFPAETLRDQFDDLSEEVKVTFESTDDTVLQAVNEGEPGPVESITVRVEVSGLDPGDVASGTIGDEVISEFPADIVRDEGTVETLEITCEGYETHTEDVTFDENKTITVTLEKEATPDYIVTFGLNGGLSDQGASYIEVIFPENSTGGNLMDYFIDLINNGTVIPPENKGFNCLTTQEDDTSTMLLPDFRLDQDITVYPFWIEELTTYNVTFDFNGGELNGESSWTEDVQEGDWETTTFFENNILSDENFIAPEGKQFVGLTTVVDDSSTLVEDPYTVSGDVTLYAYWETIMCTVTVDYVGGVDPNGDTSMTNDVPYGTVLLAGDFPSSDITPPTGKEFGALSTDLSDPEAEFEELEITGDTTVYIVWDTIVCGLTIDLGSATYEGEHSILDSIDYGDSWTVGDFENDYLPNLVLPHHAYYVGITTVQNDDSTLIDPNESITITQDMTVYLYLEYEQN